METHNSLVSIVKKCSAGSTSAFRLLFDETRDDLFRFIRLRVSTREDALDVLQECYVDMWQALKSGKFVYVSDPELRGFLCLIARRRIAKLYRLWKPQVSLEDIVETSDTSFEEVSERGAAVSALQKLSHRDREVVELRYFSGLSFREIADLLNSGESAVKVRHHRAIEKLKHLLGYEKEK
jgi:RNA polymerase sigma-70 factor, ECF subfamily